MAVAHSKADTLAFARESNSVRMAVLLAQETQRAVSAAHSMATKALDVANRNLDAALKDLAAFENRGDDPHGD